MKTRISVRSPRNCSVIETSQEFAAERRSQRHGGHTAENRRTHVERRAQVVAIGEQGDALVAEGAHRGERAAEPDRQSRTQVGGDQRGAGGDAKDEAEEERAGKVDGERAEREASRGAALDPPLESVARERTGDAPERDIEDGQKKLQPWMVRVGVISPKRA